MYLRTSETRTSGPDPSYHTHTQSRPCIRLKEPTANLTNFANQQIAHRFDCLSVTLEQPFKDCMSNKDEQYGWSPSRSRRLGGSLLDAVFKVSPYLRSDEAFWETLSPADAYVRPTVYTP